MTFTIVPAPAGSERELERRLGHVQHALHVQPPHRPPALRRDQLRRAEELPARVVDEQVQAAVALEHRARSAALRLAALADVARHPVDLARELAAASSPISAAACSSTSARRPAIVTVAPQRASSSAVALPRPVPPPVTSATLARAAAPARTPANAASAASIASDHRHSHRSAARCSPARSSVPEHRLGFVRVPQAAGLRFRAHPRRLSVVELVADGNHDVLALVSGLTLPPLAVACAVAAGAEPRAPDRPLRAPAPRAARAAHGRAGTSPAAQPAAGRRARSAPSHRRTTVSGRRALRASSPPEQTARAAVSDRRRRLLPRSTRVRARPARRCSSC